MDKFPRYQVGTRAWDDYGADGFNEYGYNEQGVDRSGHQPIIVMEKYPTWFANDDSDDAALVTRSTFRDRYSIPWDSMLRYFFVPDPIAGNHSLNGHIVYAANTPNISNLQWDTGNYRVISGIDTSAWRDGNYEWLTE